MIDLFGEPALHFIDFFLPSIDFLFSVSLISIFIIIFLPSAYFGFVCSFCEFLR